MCSVWGNSMGNYTSEEMELFDHLMYLEINTLILNLIRQYSESVSNDKELDVLIGFP